MTAPLVEVRDLAVTFPTRRGDVRAVAGTDLEVRSAELFGLVGETGCGKSVTALALMGLLPKSARMTGSICFKGTDLSRLGPKGMRGLRGREMAMIFQDPFESLNPVLTIGEQIREALGAHGVATGRQAGARVERLLDEVRIPDPARFSRSYPHEASGGMRQRAMIAMALSCDPALLIADEPTTALDVTTQAGILELFLMIKKRRGMSILLITHDLALVSQVADRVGVMYAGRIVEVADRDPFFKDPQHPYSKAILACVPRIDAAAEPVEPIPGEVPSPLDYPGGCPFHPRCSWVTDQCRREDPELIHRRGPDAHHTACWEVRNVTGSGP